MRKYSIPCIISLLVAALYNIVDQIFIANATYLGSYGNAANTVAFPLTVVALAIAVMIGDGACAFVSICLGAHNGEDAHRTVGSAILLCLGASLLATATAYTKDGRLVEAQPLEWRLAVEEPDDYPPISHLILKAVQTSPAKAQYRVGDKISFWCEMIMDGDVMPEYMVVSGCINGSDSVDFVCETGDGGASSPGGVYFGSQAFAASIGGSYTVTLGAEDVFDGCVSLTFEGACAMKSGEGFSHNSNRVTFTFPIS